MSEIRMRINIAPIEKALKGEYQFKPDYESRVGGWHLGYICGLEEALTLAGVDVSEFREKHTPTLYRKVEKFLAGDLHIDELKSALEGFDSSHHISTRYYVKQYLPSNDYKSLQSSFEVGVYARIEDTLSIAKHGWCDLRGLALGYYAAHADGMNGWADLPNNTQTTESAGRA